VSPARTSGRRAGPRVVPLADRRRWLRVADTAWRDPLDPSHAARVGGRWNPPDSFPTLYLNADLATARAQIGRLLAGQPVRPEDLDDPPWMLVAATLPARQRAADAVTDEGLRALGLPTSYPLDTAGRPVSRAPCQAIGAALHARQLDGVFARSAATPDGSGRELAWFPRGRARARRAGKPVPFARWWHVRGEEELFGEGERE
jgi:hypothetical protein